MWTPRRILMLTLAVAAVVTIFAIYNRMLGWIDGLPALPEKYLAAAKPDQLPVESHRGNRVERSLREAFGDNCAELGYNYKDGLGAGGVFLAFNDVSFEDDGRVRVWPFSLAIVGKVNPKTGFPEINTVHCDVARITFDRKIVAFSEIAHSKLVAAEFACDPSLDIKDPRRDYVYVVNNHATQQADDDLIAKARGPVYFEDTAAKHPDKPQLWTTTPVDITDYQTRPPQNIKSQNMKVFLEAEATKSGDRSAQPKEKHSSPIRQIELDNVDMSLTVDKSSDFLGSQTAKSPQPTRNGDSQPIHIQTLGAFVFDVRTDRAFFTIPPENSGPRQYVRVWRAQPQGNDEMICDRMELQFRKRGTTVGTKPAPVDASDAGAATQIESLAATGEKVVITSAAESLYAVGDQLVFNNERREVSLHGTPMMSAIKEGNRIETALFIMHRADPNQPAPPVVTLAKAPGPGTLYLHDEKGARNIEARWQGELLMDHIDERDRISFTGNAQFEDRESHQWLSGDEIKIWLKPQDSGNQAQTARKPGDKLSEPAPRQLSRVETQNHVGPPPPPSTGQRGRPEKMHVLGNVKARTPDLKIDDTPMLVLWFQDVDKIPANLLVQQPAPSPMGPPSGISPMALSPNTPTANGTSSALTQPPNATKKNPIEVSAEYVEATIVRDSERSELSRVNCRARVHVHQLADDPKDRPTDLTAQLLELLHTPDGDVLHLTGDSNELAKVEAREMALHGPQITFDQRDNRADVDGAGYVVLTTATNMSGEKLDRPTDITINWNGHMDLVGNRISFRGGVQAEQTNVKIVDSQPEKELNKLLCPRMDITLDRPVAFKRMSQSPPVGKQANGDDQPKIKRVQCHRGDEGIGKVTVASTTWRNSRLVRYHQLVAPEISYENDVSEMSSTGPGEMRLFQLGDAIDPIADPKATSLPAASTKKSAAPNEQTFKLTQVQFADHMHACDRKQWANFKGQVRVYHGPTNDQNLVINPDKLQSGFFTLTCQELDVATHTQGAKRWATMDAKGRADVYAPDFSGRADVIKFDEQKKQLVVLGSSENSPPAALYYSKGERQVPDELLAREIFYWRATNEYKLVNAVGATGAK